MKTFLIQPKVEGGFKTPPLGLQLIATVLKQNGYHQIYDLDPNKGDDYYNCDYSGPNVLVGMSVTFMTLSEAFKLAAFIKKHNRHAVIVFGGPQATLMPRESISDANVDIVAVGEGLFTLCEIAGRLKRNTGLNAIKGIWYKDDTGEVFRNPPRPFIKDLDTIPFADRTFFNEIHYRRHRNSFLEKLVIPPVWHIMSAQSCPYNCKMCQPALRKIAGPWRQRSVENVIAEMKQLRATYNARYFAFNDNDMGINRKWLQGFCRAAAEMQGLRMSCLGRANLLDYDMLKLMKKAGFDTIYFGAESGSDRVLKEVLNKKTRARDIVTFAKNCHRLKIMACAYWMIANPGESIQEMQATAELASTLPTFYCHFHIATPNPETRYYHDAKRDGYLNLVSWNDVHNRACPTIIKPGVTVADIVAMDAYLIKTMLHRGWNYRYNGHTLSFVNTRRFAGRYPLKVFGHEINLWLKDRKAYHFRNMVMGLKTLLRNE